MSIEAAERNIRNCMIQIGQYEEIIVGLRKDIKKLEELERQYVEIMKEFKYRNEMGMQQIENMCHKNTSLRMVYSYVEGMKKILTGRQYYQVEDDMSESRKIVIRKIIKLEEEIQQYEQRIRKCETDMQYSWNEIRLKENVENG